MQPEIQLNYSRRCLLQLSFLKSISLANVTALDASENYLTSLRGLEKEKYPRMKSLNFSVNLLSCIDGFRGTQMPQLETLYLHGNQIEDLGPLSKLKAPRLTELRLGFRKQGNRLRSTETICSLDFPSLQELRLDSCDVRDVNFLRKASFCHLTHLHLSANNVETFENSILSKFECLKVLCLKSNCLSTLSFMRKINCPQLQYLNISHNIIPAASSIGEVSEANLSVIFINGNLIEDFCPLFKVVWTEMSQIKYYEINNICTKRLFRQLQWRFTAK